MSEKNDEYFYIVVHLFPWFSEQLNCAGESQWFIPHCFFFFVFLGLSSLPCLLIPMVSLFFGFVYLLLTSLPFFLPLLRSDFQNPALPERV